MDKTKKMALDTTYWSMLWPGCKIYSFPDIRNKNVFNFVCSKFGLLSIFFAPTCFLIVSLILYGILLIFISSFNCCCSSVNDCCSSIKEFLWNRISDVPTIVVAQHYASTKAYQSIKNLSAKRSKTNDVVDESKSTEINIINPLHNNIETNNDVVDESKSTEINIINPLHNNIETNNTYPQHDLI